MSADNYHQLRAIFHKSPAERVGPPIREELWKRSIETSLDFVERHLSTALCFSSRSELHAYALTKMPREGLVCEFGVFKGDSINALADAFDVLDDDRVIYGFDSFQGLSEDWSGHGVLAGHFNLEQELPTVRSKVRLISGWIDETLPGFLASHPESFALTHIDMDTYTPTKIILENIEDRLRPGSIMIFDELIAYPGWQHHEYRALMECVSKPYEFIAFSGHHAAIRFI
ncbi:MAG: class I SAM-dependent methyltransferase [Pseudomonadota bacterium]